MKNKTKHISESCKFTVDVLDSGKFTINIQNCSNFTISLSNCKNYSIDRQYSDVEEAEKNLAICKPRYLWEDVTDGSISGLCRCKYIVKNSQKFCHKCGIRLDWNNVRKQERCGIDK